MTIQTSINSKHSTARNRMSILQTGEEAVTPQHRSSVVWYPCRTDLYQTLVLVFYDCFSFNFYNFYANRDENIIPIIILSTIPYFVWNNTCQFSLLKWDLFFSINFILIWCTMIWLRPIIFRKFCIYVSVGYCILSHVIFLHFIKPVQNDTNELRNTFRGFMYWLGWESTKVVAQHKLCLLISINLWRTFFLISSDTMQPGDRSRING